MTRNPKDLAGRVALMAGGTRGAAVVALAADPTKLASTSTATATWQLVKDYGSTDVDGTRPDWGKHAANALGWSA